MITYEYRLSSAGERFGRICPTQPIVPTDRLPTDAGLRFDAPVAPSELQQGENLRFLWHFQDNASYVAGIEAGLRNPSTEALAKT